jgi:hypothetical protein
MWAQMVVMRVRRAVGRRVERERRARRVYFCLSASYTDLLTYILRYEDRFFELT